MIVALPALVATGADATAGADKIAGGALIAYKLRPALPEQWRNPECNTQRKQQPRTR